MTLFAQEGGTAIISGDHNILKNWPDLITYKESNLIGFFPPPKFNQLSGYAKAALLIRWWPTILEKINQSSRGDTWRMPMHCTPDINSFQCLGDPRFGKDGKIIFNSRCEAFSRTARELDCDEDEDRFNAHAQDGHDVGPQGGRQPVVYSGCGEAVKPNRKYLPGHDQKLRLRIEKSIGGLEALKELG